MPKDILPNGHKQRGKLIFVGNDKFQIKKLAKIAKDNSLEFLTYSEGEWATLEEIDQYIQEEELSKQVVSLPVGQNLSSSLDAIEEAAIKKVIHSVNGNMIQAARTLKIARATLYRKIERYGLNLKKQREKQYKTQKQNSKRAA